MNQFDFLNTGNSGVTFGNEETPQVVDEALAEQQLELSQLLPSVAAIIETIDAEITAVCDLRAYVKTLGARPTKAQIENEYAARELFITMAERLKTNIANKVADAERSL